MPSVISQRYGRAGTGTLFLTVGLLAVAGILTGNVAQVSAQSTPGAIRGRVFDADTKQPLVAANVMLLGTTMGAFSTADGSYVMPNVPPGSYIVQFSFMGYQNVIRPDVIVGPGRSIQVDAELKTEILTTETVVVTAGYFKQDDSQPVSGFGLNAEEVRRAPGSAGDISRVLQALPSTAQMMDNANDLFVRGGSPFENGFFIDHIQVPNINHFPVLGATGGPIGMVNVEFIEDVRFSAGGFSAAWGDRLSSVIDIDFREGNHDKTETRIEVNMAGFGATVEGPLANNRGTWFVAARRSFLDLIAGAISTGVAPNYGDLHAKATIDLGPSDRISLLGLGGLSSIAYIRSDAEDNSMSSFGDYTARQGTVGMSWRHLWQNRGYTVNALSMAATNSQDDWFRTTTGDSAAGSDNIESAVRFRNFNHLQLAPGRKIEFGVEAEFTRADYDYYFKAYTDRLGNSVPGLELNDIFHGTRLGAFVSHIWNPAERLTLTLGLRADHYAEGNETALSPRVAASFRISDTTRLNGAAGIYHQRLPSVILSQDPVFESLHQPRATHLIIGIDHELSPSTRLTLEAYRKNYDRLPLEPSDPTLFVVDDGTSMSRFRRYVDLVDEGEATSTGIEALLQKKLATDIYGLVSAALFRSRYRDINGTWRDRTYDNRYLFNVVGGYKPSHKLEISARWGIAGGGPYTPFDVALSTAANSGIIDTSRMNGERYPAYHTLNLRVDRRFVYKQSSLTLSFSLWNVYNRQNVAFYHWDEIENKRGTMYQWSFFPIVGMEWEF